MEDVGAIAAFDDHVGGVGGVPVIDFDLPADEIVHGDEFPIKAEAVGAFVLVEAVCGEEFLEVGVVDFAALGLVV